MSTRLLLLGLLFVLFCAACSDDDDNDIAPADDDADDDAGDDDLIDDDLDDDTTPDDDAADDDAVDDDVDDDADDDVDDDIDDDSVDDDSSDDDAADDDTVAPVQCIIDADWDGWGDPSVSQEFPGECPPGWAIYFQTDCNHQDPLIHPYAPELPDDGIDQNCDGEDLVHGDDNGVFVAKTGSDDNPGTMALPKLTVQAGVELAEQAGKVVYVAEGVYEESLTTMVSIFGGYDPADWSRDLAAHEVMIIPHWPKYDENIAVAVEGGAPVALEGLKLHGGPGGDVTTGVEIREGAVELVHDWIHGGAPVPTGETAAGTAVRVLGGSVTIVASDVRGGLVTANSDAEAAGVHSDSAGCVVAWDNQINGGDAHLSSSDQGVGQTVGVLVTGPAFLKNNLVGGGYVDSGDWSASVGVSVSGAALLSDNTIDGGAASGTSQSQTIGAELHGAATLADNYIFGGSAGGIYASSTAVEADAPLTMVNNIVLIGQGSDECGVRPWSGGILVHNTIVPGPATTNGPGVYLGGDTVFVNNIINWIFRINESSLVMQHNDVWNDTASCLIYINPTECVETADELNACGWTGCASSAGNIRNDPLFVDPANGDYHLAEGSPCIDTGIDPDPWYSGSLADFDFDGDPRPSGAGWDIGMDEFASAE